MDHTFAVCPIQCVRDLCTIFQDLIQGQGPSPQSIRQCLSLHALHHQIIHPVLVSDIMQDTDVGMAQIGDGFGFPFESLLADGIRRELGGKKFERYGAIQARIPRTINLSHPACAYLFQDAVVRNRAADNGCR